MYKTNVEMKEPTAFLDQEGECVPCYEELSEEEKKEVAFIESDIESYFPDTLMQWGAPLQHQMAKRSRQVREYARTKTVEEAAETLTFLLLNMKQVTDFSNKRDIFLRLFGSPEKKGKKIKMRYDKVLETIGEKVGKLKKSRVQIKKDLGWYDEMYKENLEFFNTISLYIIAGERKVDEMEGGEARQFDACDNLEKRITELKSTRDLSSKVASLLRYLQDYEGRLNEKIQSALDDTIPLWKSKIPLVLGISDEEFADQVQRLTVNIYVLRELEQTINEADYDTWWLFGESLNLQSSIKEKLSE